MFSIDIRRLRRQCGGGAKGVLEDKRYRNNAIAPFISISIRIYKIIWVWKNCKARRIYLSSKLKWIIDICRLYLQSFCLKKKKNNLFHPYLNSIYIYIHIHYYVSNVYIPLQLRGVIVIASPSTNWIRSF